MESEVNPVDDMDLDDAPGTALEDEDLKNHNLYTGDETDVQDEEVEEDGIGADSDG